MKNQKLLSLISFIGVGILGLSFLFNLVYYLSIGAAATILPYGISFILLPIAMGMLLVPYGLKSDNRMLIYLGQVISAGSVLIMVVLINQFVIGALSPISLATLLAYIWPLALYIASLSAMAFVKKIDLRPIHRIVTLVLLGGFGIGITITLLVQIIASITLLSAFPFINLLPLLLSAIGIVPIALFAFALEDEARLVKLEVPEYRKAESKPASATPKDRVRKDEKGDSAKAGEPTEEIAAIHDSPAK